MEWRICELAEGERETRGRKVAMVLMKRLCDMTLVEVAREFRVKSYGAVG